MKKALNFQSIIYFFNVWPHFFSLYAYSRSSITHARVSDIIFVFIFHNKLFSWLSLKCFFFPVAESVTDDKSQAVQLFLLSVGRTYIWRIHVFADWFYVLFVIVPHHCFACLPSSCENIDMKFIFIKKVKWVSLLFSLLVFLILQDTKQVT